MQNMERKVKKKARSMSEVFSKENNTILRKRTSFKNIKRYREEPSYFTE